MSRIRFVLFCLCFVPAFSYAQGEKKLSSSTPSRNQDNVNWPSYKDRYRNTAPTGEPIPTSISYWSGVSANSNTTMVEHAIGLIKTPDDLREQETRTELMYSILINLFFSSPTYIESEIQAVQAILSSEKAPPFQREFAKAYEKMVKEISREKKNYSQYTLNDQASALAHLGLMEAKSASNTDFRKLIQWEEVQEGSTCVSHSTVSCLKAAQPLVAQFLYPKTLHQQIKKFEKKYYGVTKPRDGVLTETLVSMLQEEGYRILFADLEEESKTEAFARYLKQSLMTPETNIEPSNAKVTLKAKEYWVLPYQIPINKAIEDITEEDLENRKVSFQGDVQNVLQCALSQESPLLPIVMLDTYDSRTEGSSQTAALPVRKYFFNPLGMGHAVMISGHEPCPSSASAKPETCYMIRDSLKDQNYALVPASNLLKRAMSFIFLSKTELSIK